MFLVIRSPCRVLSITVPVPSAIVCTGFFWGGSVAYVMFRATALNAFFFGIGFSDDNNFI